jgi:hypothetical protein
MSLFPTNMLSLTNSTNPLTLFAFNVPTTQLIYYYRQRWSNSASTWWVTQQTLQHQTGECNPVVFCRPKRTNRFNRPIQFAQRYYSKARNMSLDFMLFPQLFYLREPRLSDI